MLVKVKLTALAQGQWYEYVIRFVLGGLIAALAGLIAVAWCPPARRRTLSRFSSDFPASATLIEKHEREEREVQLRRRTARHGSRCLEADGAALGSLGLVAFGAVV